MKNVFLPLKGFLISINSLSAFKLVVLYLDVFPATDYFTIEWVTDNCHPKLKLLITVILPGSRGNKEVLDVKLVSRERI